MQGQQKLAKEEWVSIGLGQNEIAKLHNAFFALTHALGDQTQSAGPIQRADLNGGRQVHPISKP